MMTSETGRGVKRQDTDAERFWHIRAANYDKLYWTRDQEYLRQIVQAGVLEKHHLALDVGTGSGAVAMAIKPYVRHVVAIDTSSSMLSNGQWCDVSVLNLDIGDSFFANALFDRVFARMVFHHILDNLDRAVLRCFDILKPSGLLIVAEGVPPVDDPEVAEWFTDMFAMKEDRRTFLPSDLVKSLERNGFQDVHSQTYIMKAFSIRNWLENSGLPEDRQEAIMAMHRNAEDNVKRAFNMRFEKDDCLVSSRNVIVVGQKKKGIDPL